ncbi:MAG: hypothetical protein U5L96_08330 [Owenweeksia sp.]|nr:hypothetical protein [Owenweeksia sp.]
MKHFFALALVCLCMAGWSQSTLYHENFDLPSGADSTSASSSGGINPNLGSTVNTLAVSPTQSYRIQGSQSQTEIYLETQSFSTVGNPYVLLDFDHIAKLVTHNHAKLQYTVDGGQNWNYLSNNQYLGSDPNMNNFNRFSSDSHQNNPSFSWLPLQPLAIPTNNWWVHERFNLTGVVSDTTGGNFTGYPNVKIRFIGEFNSNLAGNSYAAGWFIDNIKITAATQEFQPPELSFDFKPQSCYKVKIQGITIANLNQSYPIGILAADTGQFNSGIDSLTLYHQVNAGPLSGQKMPRQSQGPMEYKATISGINSGDTVEYYIEAYDQAGNLTRSPASGFYQFIPDSTVPGKCNSIFPCQTTDIISSFPWKENFEGPEWHAGTGNGNTGSTHRGSFPVPDAGSWMVGPDSTKNFGWSVRRGPTGTAKTGPNSDHTSGDGKYLYSEFTPIQFLVRSTTFSDSLY